MGRLCVLAGSLILIRMNTQRLEQLRQLRREDPDDPFLPYAIAAELRESAPEEALKLYRQLLDNHPDYLPTYYQAAGLLMEMEAWDESKAIYQKGMELSKERDPHTYQELNSAYQLLLLAED